MLISIIEIAVVTTVIVGFCFESKVIDFEEKLAKKIKIALAGSNSSDERKNNLVIKISKKGRFVKK